MTLCGLSTLGLFGSFLREAARHTLQALALVVGVNAARQQPDGPTRLLALFAAAVTANQIGRFLSYLALQGRPPYSDALLSAASFIAIALTVWLAFGVLARHKTSQAAYPADASDMPGTDDPVIAASIDFARRFDAVCNEHGLTAREREVLFKAVHGYTIDHIAEQLVLSRETVKSTLSRAYTRAGINGKQQFLAMMDARAPSIQSPAGNQAV